MKYFSIPMNLSCRSFAFLLGVTSIISQIVLLREYLSAFYGNELIYALILAGWMFWVAAGSFVVSRFSRRDWLFPKIIAALVAVSAVFLPATILFVRSIKTLLNVPGGEMLGLFPMGAIVVVSLLPLTFLFGSLFALLCSGIDRENSGSGEVSGANTVYLWESLGATFGGAVATFVFLRFLSGLEIAFVVGIMNLTVALLVFSPRRAWIKAAGAVLVALIIFHPQGLVRRLDEISRRMQWRNFTVAANTDSIYGNITLLKLGEEYSLYENGLLSFTPGDRLASEEKVHFAMLAHPVPQKVLLVSGGIAGGLDEILKYPRATIDYVELDPKVVDVSRKNLPPKFLQSLADERVHLFYSDARLFVKTTPRRYDVVILALPNPATALINRYYTREFFSEVSRILTPQGVLGLSVSSSENYVNEESKTFLRSVNSTLKTVFPAVRAIPGDTNVFLAGKKVNRLTVDPQIFIHRLKERGIKAQYVSEYYLPSKLSPDRLEYIQKVLAQPGRLNTDSRPAAYFYDLVLWSTHFNTGFKDLVGRVQGLRWEHLLVFPALILVGGLFWRRFAPDAPVRISILVTGFSQIIFQIIVILAFQTLYGYVYYKVGFIFTAFMLGLVLGSLFARRIVRLANGVNTGEVKVFYQFAQLGMVLYPLLLPLSFVVFREAVSSPKLLLLFNGTFTLLPVAAGFLGGMQYPLAVYLLTASDGKKEKGGRAAGFLYALDVLGGAVGALLTGTFLVPLLGINAVAFFCAAINAAVFILLWNGKRK